MRGACQNAVNLGRLGHGKCLLVFDCQRATPRIRPLAKKLTMPQVSCNPTFPDLSVHWTLFETGRTAASVALGFSNPATSLSTWLKLR
jgi:hypothetical protein